MFVPRVIRRNVFDDFFDYPFGSVRETAQVMKTDVRETDQGYELAVDLPGLRRDDVTAELKDGYLHLCAETAEHHDTQDDSGRYIRRERFSGSYSRSFYVGEDVTEEDIRARFDNGVLRLSIPKKETRPAAESRRYIAIEE